MINKELIPFTDVLSALQDQSKPFPPRLMQRFSDLSENEAGELQKAWPRLDEQRKENLLNDLIEIEEDETLVCFDAVGKVAVTDATAAIRLAGIQLLEPSEDYAIAVTLIKMMKHDPDENIRAEAACALGKYVYMGEVEDLTAEKYERILTALFVILRGADTPKVRQKVLESLGYSCHEDVPDQIQKAFSSNDKNWRLSALIAMGHSADERWSAPVLSLIHSKDWDLRFEAIRAAGELELKEARLPLLRMLKAGQDDLELRQTMICALARIGGENVRTELERLYEAAQDDAEAEFIERALDELDFTEEFRTDIFMNIPAPDEGDLDTFIDIEDESDDTYGEND